MLKSTQDTQVKVRQIYKALFLHLYSIAKRCRDDEDLPYPPLLVDVLFSMPSLHLLPFLMIIILKERVFT